MEDLKNWIELNSINCAIINNLVEIPDLGVSIFIQGVGGKIIENEDSKNKEDYYFILTEDETLALENEEIKFIIFKWGSRFYYSKRIEFKDEYHNICYKPEFNPFLNIGSYEEDELEFTNLGIHSGYELLNGSKEPKEWVAKAKFTKQKRLGWCDKNSLGSALAFQIECDKAKIEPIIGATYSVAYEYKEGDESQELYDIKLYVKNEKGWRNLLRINKEVNVIHGGFIPEEILLTFGEGIICVIPTDSYFNKIHKEKENFSVRLEVYEEYFDELFYQLDFTEMLDSETWLEKMKMYDFYFKNYYDLVRPIYIPDSYYIERIDSKVKTVLNRIGAKSEPMSEEQYFKTSNLIISQSLEYFSEEHHFDRFIEAMENTNVLAKQCNYRIDIGNHKLPKFPHEDPVGLYYELIAKGFEKKVFEKYEDEPEKLQEYFDRIEEENSVIVDAGFVHYFLILWDIVEWAKSENILVGVGRGSAGGSLVAYLLGIIEIDPIEFDLLFERFLNKTRVSGERAKSADALPDIDVDFEGQRRGDVKRYIERKYGIDNVCSIGTYSRMKVKSALKDFGKIEGLNFDTVNIATKQIPNSIKSYWKDIFDIAIDNPKLKSFVQSNAELVENIQGILGQPRTSSIHASAVLILPKEDEEGNPMTAFDWLPVRKIDGVYVSEWEGKYIDSAGFLKEDILGIAQLDKFQAIVTEIERNQGFRLDLNEIDFNIDYVFDYFKKGWNEDVFQFGTTGLKGYSRKVKPDHIEDLISMNAVFRPGPMDSGAHNDFADIKHGKKKPKYDAFLKEVTRKTNGLYIFQEQVMQAMVVGGMTLAEADQVRTYMKKFDDKALAKFKEKFTKGYSKLFKKGDGKKEAQIVWDKLYAFSAYGFNRSHAAAYSLMGYWCQFLKIHFPLEFWTSSLNFSDEKTEVPYRLAEIHKINMVSDEIIEVKPPDINKSDVRFTCDPDLNEIYWSLTKIKHAGDVAVKEILTVRKEGGAFFSLDEFISRVTKSKVNKRVVTNLIISGAFDNVDYGESGEIVGKEQKGRYQLLKYYYSKIKQDVPEEIEGSKDKFKNWFWVALQREITGFGDVNYLELLRQKTKLKKYVSTYWTGHELEQWKAPKHRRNDFGDGEPITIAGRIIRINENKDKNGDPFFRFSIENNNSEISVICWKDGVKKLGKELIELDKTKAMFAIYGEAFFDTWRGINSFKVTKNSKIIKL